LCFTSGANGNNHDATELQDVAVNPENDATPKKKTGISVKEHSILQRKLTKLAIKIGYVGKFRRQK
jgi:hypothetical protein